MTTMKPKLLFSRINFALLALVATLAGALFITGCETADSNSSSNTGNSGNQHSHH